MFNDEMIKGKWTEIKGDILSQWGKLTDNELDQAKGNLASIVGIILQRYGSKKEDVQEKLHKITSKFLNKTEDVKNEMKKKVS